MKWIQTKINEVLKSLIDLKNIKENNPSIKALAYQLYENNGVLKREQVSEYLKSLGQNERKILRDLGVKFGRYHVFLYQLIKPEAVSLRTLLWKNFNQKDFEYAKQTIKFIKARKWNSALKSSEKVKNSEFRNLITWMYLKTTGNSATFNDYKNFIEFFVLKIRVFKR